MRVFSSRIFAFSLFVATSSHGASPTHIDSPLTLHERLMSMSHCHTPLLLSSPLKSVLCLTLLGTILFNTACKKEQTKEDSLVQKSVPMTRETRTEDGLIVRTYDYDNDGRSEVTRYFEEIPDPDAPEDIIRRMKKMEMDVNSDGKINVIRHYGLTGKLEHEELDQDLDGVIDVISYYDKGVLARKEILKSGSTEVDYVRYYANDELLRVEKDMTGDGKIDYWEFYEQGILTRVGRDFNADGRADSWQTR